MKKITITKNLIFVATVLLLSACSTFFDKDNTPAPAKLVDFKPEAQVQSLWYTSTGIGSNSDYLKLTPAISNTTIFTASKNGVVAANNMQTGKSLWTTNTGGDISGGTAAYGNLVYVGTRAGNIYALNQSDGKILWKATSS